MTPGVVQKIFVPRPWKGSDFPGGRGINMLNFPGGRGVHHREMACTRETKKKHKNLPQK